MVLRIATSGVAKQEMAGIVKRVGGAAVEVSLLSDIEAVMAVKEGRAEVLLGSCLSGQGSALALAIALLGREHCAAIATPARTAGATEIRAAIAKGTVAFGIVLDAVDSVVPTLVQELLEHHGAS